MRPEDTRGTRENHPQTGVLYNPIRWVSSTQEDRGPENKQKGHKVKVQVRRSKVEDLTTPCGGFTKGLKKKKI